MTKHDATRNGNNPRVPKELADYEVDMYMYSFFAKNLRYFKFSIIYIVLRIISRIKRRLPRPRLGVLYQYDPKILTLRKHQKTKTLKNPPTISIVTPSYNQCDFLDKTIASLVEQQYPKLEYIVQDGASTDNSVEVIKKYAPFIKHWESIKDNGQSHAINLGFRHATGEIMAYLNSDDILFPDTLHYVADYFEQHPEVDVVYGHRILIDENGNNVGRWILPPHDAQVLTWADYVPQETLFWRRSIWEKVGGQIDESFRFAMDWDLLLRFKEANANFVRLPRVMGAFRIHSQQKTSAQINSVGVKEMERLRQRAHGRDVAHEEVMQNVRPYLIKHMFYDILFRLGVLKY